MKIRYPAPLPDDEGGEILLNGAKVTSMVDVVSQVHQGMIPRESGLAILMAAFLLSLEEAEEIIGTEVKPPPDGGNFFDEDEVTDET